MSTSFKPPVFGAGDFSAPVNQGSGHTLYVGLGGHATIQAAINEAAEGETIFVQPGSYDENLTVTTDYLTIVGAQVGGYGRPDIVPETGVALTVTAQGFVCRKLRFASQDGDSCVIQRGNGFKYDDCVFDDASDAGKAGLDLLPSDTDDSFTASEGSVSNCLFRGSANAILFDTGDAPAVGVGSTDNLIVACKFKGNTLDLATADAGGAVYSVQFLEVKDCVFADKNKATYLDFTTTNGGAAGDQSGTVDGCYFATDTITTTKIKAVGTAFTFVGNYSTVGVFDGSGLD